MAPTRRGVGVLANTRGTRTRNRRIITNNAPTTIQNLPLPNVQPTPIIPQVMNISANNIPVISGVTPQNASRINGIALLTTFFDGEPNECNFFFKQFNDIATLSGWTDLEKLTILKTRLRGNALTFVLSDRELSETNDYNLVTERLVEFFSEEKGITDHQTKFSTCQQWEGESVKNFAYRVTMLTNNYLGTTIRTENQETKEILDRLKLSKFVDSLLPELRIDVLKTNPQNFNDAVTAAMNSQKANETLKKK